ncbi:hypothetical protein PHYBOEH_001660 [Phytophthora boehmeriae]|uniref:RxLR effector protein n=1 Tax=Phytophthora boehmeriae TaxID=109152 RepID=A0A8T1V7G7_9STRA|nr:hypothetical protein PHYBOEH_001660 [Phytophthora boehmeriae]
MRLHYFLLVTAATLLAGPDVVAVRENSVETVASTTNLAPSVRSLAAADAIERNNKRFLRRMVNAHEDEEDEEGEDDEDKDDEDDDDEDDDEERVNTGALKKLSSAEKLRQKMAAVDEGKLQESLLKDMLNRGIINERLAKHLKTADIKADDIAKMFNQQSAKEREALLQVLLRRRIIHEDLVGHLRVADIKTNDIARMFNQLTPKDRGSLLAELLSRNILHKDLVGHLKVADVKLSDIVKMYKPNGR